MTNLKDEQLINVAGGSSRERNIGVKVNLTEYKDLAGDILIEPYLDGVLIQSQIKTVDSSISEVTIFVKGRGMGMLKVKIASQFTKFYSINFETGSYVEEI